MIRLQDFLREAKLLLAPIPFSVNTYQMPDLFAGKLHAVLYRQWKNRVKGRDWYDLMWYIARNTPVRLSHLQQRMQQTADRSTKKPLQRDELIKLLLDKIKQVNFASAKQDVYPFLKNPQQVDLWSSAFFQELIERLQVI